MKLRNKLVIGLSALAIVTGSYFGLVHTEKLSEIHKTELPEREVTSLTTETSNTFRDVSRKSEKDGLADLLKYSTDEKNNELSWLYSHCEQRWYNIRRSGDAYEVSTDFEVWKKLIESCNQVTDYHTHQCKELSVFGMKSILLTFATLPSVNDLLVLFSRSGEFYEKHQKGNYKYDIISPLGITELETTSEFRKIPPEGLFYISQASLTFNSLLQAKREIKSNSFEGEASKLCDYLTSIGDVKCTFIPAQKVREN